MLFIATALAAAPSDLDAHLRLLDAVEHPADQACLTTLVAELRQHWSHFAPEERAHVSALLSPDGRDLFAPAPVAAAPPPAKDSCWSTYDNRLASEHFVVEWEDGVDPDDAQQFSDDLESSWAVEVGDLGWSAPDGSDHYLILATIANHRTYGAYTTVKSCGGKYIPYIVTGKDSWTDPYWGQSMAPHEFNHALQFGYSYAPEFWWWEATATFMEDQVFPTVNYWSPYIAGYTDLPYIALSASSQSDQDVFNHMYGLAIFAFYLNDYQGGESVVLQTWADSRRDSGQYSKSAKDMVTDLGLDWDTVYADWVTKNTVMDYDQQRWYPLIDVHDEVRKLPAEGASARGDKPQGYGQNYIFFNKDLGRGDLVVHFTGDDRVEWSVQLVETRTQVRRVSSAVTTDSVVDVTLEGYGDEEAWLVVSPLSTKEDDYDYAWTAEIVSPPDTGGGDTAVTDDTGDRSARPGTETPAGCGCDQGGGGFSGVFGVLGAAALTRRAGRRRR